MKFFRLVYFCFFLLYAPLYVFGFQNVTANDTLRVKKLITDAYDSRMSDALLTISKGTQALELAKQLHYENGIADAYRTIGIGYAYQYTQDKALDNYLQAYSHYQSANNKAGIAKVFNNIGNLYRDNDYGAALKYFNLASQIAIPLNDKQLIATIYLNEGNVFLRKRDFTAALGKFDDSRRIFEQVHDESNIISCIQNSGVAYFSLNEYDKAKELLIQASEGAKKLEMKTSVASIDLTLADISIAQNNFVEAEKYIKEGSSYAQNSKMYSDFEYTNYQLEYKRKNYEKALSYLTDIYRKDSSDYKNYVSQQIALLQDQFNNAAKMSEIQIKVEKQKNTKYLFWGSAIAAFLLMIVIVLLVANVKRKNETNKRLTELNGEVSRQKDNLDRINHHLEEIIDERTKDLQIKNKKLSEYSSYLSHQIRGPIATLKGLLNLEKEKLVDEKECISMMDKCVSEIDDKIIDMSDMLHDPERTGF